LDNGSSQPTARNDGRRNPVAKAGAYEIVVHDSGLPVPIYNVENVSTGPEQKICQWVRAVVRVEGMGMVGWNKPAPLILNEYGTSVEYNAHGNT
jgi:hypothetical protein